MKWNNVRPYFARSHECLIGCIVSLLSYCYLSFSLFEPFVLSFSNPSFLFRGMSIYARLYGSCRFLWLQFFFPALLGALFLCIGFLQCNSFWSFSCLSLALHSHSCLYFYRLLSSVDVFLHEQKTRTPCLLSSTHWLRMERLRCSRCICVKAIRLSREAV